MPHLYWLLIVMTTSGNIAISPPFFTQKACEGARDSVRQALHALEQLEAPYKGAVVAGCYRVSKDPEKQT